ncbi:MAG: carboxypeptidase-like regulatory domain-containing protein, partial [Armatimonadota bacterium]|nr:carboxypeptidase-like regulatory domain-containing protein [Armatimonadota bacterium]
MSKVRIAVIKPAAKPQRAALAALILGLILWHCLPGYTQPLSDRRPLTGRVTRLNGIPIGGADVIVRREDEIGARPFWGGISVTNARGEFSFPDAQEDTYHIAVEAPGYAREERTYTLTAVSPPLQVALTRLSSLPLRVLKSDGTPLANTWVSVRMHREGALNRPLYRRRTDADGMMTLLSAEPQNQPDLVPGRYSLHAVSPGVGYAILDHIDVPEENVKTAEVRLEPGGTLQVVASQASDTGEGGGRAIGGAAVFLTQAFPEAGTVNAVDQGQTPTDAGLYQLYGNGSAIVTRDGDGRVELKDVAPGRYIVRLFLNGSETPAPQTVEIK